MKPETIITVACLLLSCAAIANAHPFHGSAGEMQYDAESGKLEIAVRVWPADLERAMQIKLEQRVDLDDTRQSEEQLKQYLKTSFIVNHGDEQLSLEWVGSEAEGSHLWLYFEVPVDSLAAVHQLEFTNSICFEAVRDQSNSLTLRDGQRRTTLRFNGNQPSATLPAKRIELFTPPGTRDK